MSEEHEIAENIERLQTTEVDTKEPKVSLLDKVLSTTEDELHPWEAVVLPSRGLYYDGQVPGGVVEVKPMGLYADKVLTTQRLVRSGEALEYIYKKYVRLPNDFDHQSLLDDDRSFLLYYLRGITHGNSYEFILTCPHCDGVSNHEYDLNELYDTVTPPNPNIGEEPFSVRLPDFSELCGSDFCVKVRFLRGYDTSEMLGTTRADAHAPGRARSRKKKDWRNKHGNDKIKDHGETLDETLERNINRIIVSADGELDRGKIGKMVEKMSSADINSVVEFLRENSPGVDTSIETNCTKCDTIIVTPLPITASFFRPKKRRASRE
jgi:hypothetical protein